MKEYFHDLLLPLGVDEEITDGILKNGCTVPTGIPGLTLSVRMYQNMSLDNNGLKLSVDNGSIVLDQQIIDNLSFILAEVSPDTLTNMQSAFKTFAFSFDHEFCSTFFSIDSVERKLEVGIQFSDTVEIADNLKQDAVIEYKITYQISDKNSPNEAALFDKLSEILVTIKDHATEILGCALIIAIIAAIIIFAPEFIEMLVPLLDIIEKMLFGFLSFLGI